MEILTAILMESFSLLARMSPYLIFGLLAAGAIHVFMPSDFVIKYLSNTGTGAVVRAAILGIPLPICSCGVVPVAASLKKSGAGNGATVSFLITTPTSGIDSMLSTYALLGGFITFARVFASFVIGVASGIITTLFVSEKKTQLKPQTDLLTIKNTPGEYIKQGLEYSFVELLSDISRPFLIGILLAGVISYFLPANFFDQYFGNLFWTYALMTAVGIPLYVCASGSIPLAAAFLLTGVSPGAVLIFLITGPATNIATISVIWEMLGKKTLLIYLTTLSAGAWISGYVTDVFLTGFPNFMPKIAGSAMTGHMSAGIFESICGVLLGLAVIYYSAYPFFKKFVKTSKMNDAIKINIPEMMCKNCAKKITDEVKNLDDVQKIKILVEEKMAITQLAPQCDINKVLDAIKKAGYISNIKSD